MNPHDSQKAALDIASHAFQASQVWEQAAHEHMRPSVVFRPTLSADGNMWCALLGDNLQEGVAGFGETPAKAMAAFDAAFYNERTPTASRLVEQVAA